MIIEERKHLLKNGQELTLRSLEEKDAEAFLEFYKQLTEESDFLLKYKEEINITVEDEKQLINNIKNSPRSFMLTAFDGDNPMGNIFIAPLQDRIKLRHRARFAISILKRYQAQGLGKLLMEQAIELTKTLNYTQIELDVYESNKRAIALYKKFGFTECGVVFQGYKLKNGEYINEISMIKFLEV